MWTPYKELLSIIEMVIGHNKVEYLSDLEKYLIANRPAIIALLENPVRFMLFTIFLYCIILYYYIIVY